MKYRILSAASLLCLTLCMLTRAEGLSTPFADVQVRGVRVGRPFKVVDSAAEGLMLQNLGNSSIRVRIEVFSPTTADLRGGAKPVPDISWVRVQPHEVEIPANGHVVCRVELVVPDKRIYRKKLYQAMIWSRTAPKAQDKVTTVGAGLISRLRFQTQ
jgi:hypothetical protein